MDKKQLKKDVKQSMEEVTVVLEAVAEVVDDNPQLLGTLGYLVSKYADAFIPMMRDVMQETVNEKEAHINRLNRRGFTIPEAIKIVCGC